MGDSVVLWNTIQLSASVSPEVYAGYPVTWSVANGSGKATINAETGLLRGIKLGSVYVTADTGKKDPSGNAIKKTKEIKITRPNIDIN
jgi:uncharacterized protein YjdB